MSGDLGEALKSLSDRGTVTTSLLIMRGMTFY